MIATKDSQYLSRAYKTACEKLETYLVDGIDQEHKDEAKLAIQTVGSYSRLKAVENNESLINLNVARAMASNTEELKDAIRKSLPEYITK